VIVLQAKCGNHSVLQGFKEMPVRSRH